MNAFQKLRLWLGWCPSADALVRRKTVQFDDMTVNAPDRDGELIRAPAGWMNKYRNRILFVSFITTVAAINFFTLGGGKYHMDMFLAGLITGSIASIVTGIAEWRRLNKAAAGEFRRLQITRKRLIFNYLIIAGSIAVFAFVTGFLLVKTATGISRYYAFLSGLLLFAWTQYLEVVYWERKNMKTLIMDKLSFYAVEIKAGGSK